MAPVELTSADLPSVLVAASWVAVVLALATAATIAVDVVRRPQPMAVMNVVWPVTALFGSLVWSAAYLRWGRSAERGAGEAGAGAGDDERSAPPMPVSVFTGTSHCGAGCMLGDLLVEWLAFAVPAVLVLGGHTWLAEDRIVAVWVLDYVAAFCIGIAFQYYAIAPMRGLGLRAGLAAAVKADAWSITAWQVGMYGTMAVVQLWAAPTFAGGRLSVATPVFWAAMQVAMVVGFLTAYPVNWWLIRAGIKERM